ncbi:MAG: DUF4136 domain-containing protein [Bacteroidota bacterium]
MNRLLFPLILISIYTSGQDLTVEYDKNRDFSHYKTFSIGESEVITPKDQQLKNEDHLQKLVEDEITEELIEKGLQKVDSAGDLVVSFVAGSQARTDVERLGPLGTTPGDDSQTWSREFIMENLIIDLNDRSNNLVWRISSASTTSTGDMKNLVDRVVSGGFKKFSLKPKKVKKK